MAKIGFIGTGIMGKPMAQNLQKAGHSLFLSTHHDAAPADLLEAGAIALANPKEVAQEAEFIIVMVPDTPQVEDVLFRKDGIAEGVGPNKVVIDMSSISPPPPRASPRRSRLPARSIWTPRSPAARSAPRRRP